MEIQKLELPGGGVGTCTPGQQCFVHHCTSFSFFVQNTNSSVIMNHLIEEELQSPDSFFSGGLDMKSHCKLIQRHIDSDTGTLWLTRNLTRSSSLLVVH